MDEERKRVIQKIKETIWSILPFEQLYLFGSASKEYWDGKGDWDLLLVTAADLSRQQKWTFAKKIRIELAQMDIASDILIVSQKEQDEAMQSPHSFTRNAIHGGIKIA